MAFMQMARVSICVMGFLCAALLLLTMVSFCFIMVKAIWEWIVFVQLTLYAYYCYGYDWVHSKVAPPPVVKLLEPEPLIVIYYGYLEKAFSYLYQINFESVIMIMISLVIVLIAIRVSRKSLIRTIQRMRGLELESMRAGSRFTTGGKFPGCQVAVKRPGILIDDHVGYGIRIGSALVSPRHVFNQAESDGQIILSANDKKIGISMAALMQSKYHSDLAYLLVSDKVWSMLGISNAKCADKHTPTVATCMGLSGYSTGLLRKSELKGHLAYDGSTIPGMSGAPYHIEETVHGLHIGAAGNFNTGISVRAILAELKLFLKPEASEDVAAGFVSAKYLSSRKLWDEADIPDDVKKSWAQVNETGGYGGDYGFDDEAAKAANKTKPLMAEIGAFLSQNVIKTQGAETGEVVMQTVSAPWVNEVSEIMRQYPALLGKIKEFENRIRALEGSDRFPCSECKTVCNSEKSLEEHKVSHELRFPCEDCDVACRSLDKLKNHVATSHPIRPVCGCGTILRTKKMQDTHALRCAPSTSGLQQESAIPSDTGKSGKVVKQVFQSQASNSRGKKRKPFSRNSTSLGQNQLSPSLEGLLLEMNKSLQSLLMSCKNVPQATGGQSLGTPQN